MVKTIIQWIKSFFMGKIVEKEWFMCQQVTKNIAKWRKKQKEDKETEQKQHLF